MLIQSAFYEREVLILMNEISAPKVHLMNIKIYEMYIQRTCNAHSKCFLCSFTGYTNMLL